MAFIYMSGGWAIRVPAATRDSIATELNRSGSVGLLTLDVDTAAGAATRPMSVTIAALQIALVTDEPLPGSI